MSKLIFDFSPSTEYEMPLNSRNQRFETYINDYIKADTEDFDDLLSEESDPIILQNLSNLRSGLMEFYEFKEGASVLEVGASFGALTEGLIKRGLKVTVTEKSVFRAKQLARRLDEDVDIYVGDIHDIKFTQQFDYIVLAGILEKAAGGSSDYTKYSEYLQMLGEMLAQNGKMLIAVDNRLGLQYLSGAIDKHAKKPFAGLNNYPDGSSGRSFTRYELDRILKISGLDYAKYYYPLPDYRFPQLIYTDAFLPEDNIEERLIPYYSRNDTLVFDESPLYYDVVKAGAFPALANSFFVECSKDSDSFCDIKYATLSTDRGTKRSFVTAIHMNDTVTKRPMYTSGIPTSRASYNNIEQLRTRNIPVVEQKIDENGTVTMPYIEFPTLSNYIKLIMPTDVDRVLEILDRLYSYILASSDVVEDGEDGPILETAYMELIPLNCFYNEREDKFIFFDQEFIRKNCPAKYVMFRAIHYMYCFTSNADSYYPLDKMKERFGLTKKWDEYLAMECAFLDEVRNQKKYAWFYKSAGADMNIIRDNAAKLMSETEKRDNFTISDKMKRTWRVELNILDEIDRICKKHGITYYLVHGTLLGAVRHKGFIPWDDDIDIAMKRQDYERFISVASHELCQPLALVLPQNENNLWWGPYARLMNLETTAIMPQFVGVEGHQGIWVDILPIDYCTPDERLLKKKYKKIKHLHMLIHAKTYGREITLLGDMSRWNAILYRLLASFYSKKSLCVKLNSVMQLYSEESSEAAIFTCYKNVKTFNSNIFDSIVLLDFEGRKLPAPIGYKDYLFRDLGGDYMKFPPEEERRPKHRGIFDPDVSYSVYQEKLGNMFSGVKGKKIVLFGSGLMFEDYMKKYGDKYKPEFLVDNDENKWGRNRMGIEIKKPEAILAIPESKRLVILCSYYYKEMEPQLISMGVTDYKIYVQELDWILKTEAQSGEKHL